MANSKSLRSEYSDFKFRRKYDYFLQFKLMGADNQKIIKEAKELGFRIKESDLVKKKSTKSLKESTRKRKSKSFINRLLKYLKRR